MVDLLLDLIIKAGYDANYASSGEELVMLCPLCDDHKPRLYVSRRTFLWTCHNCGEKGNVWSFLEKVLHYDPIKSGHLARLLEGPKLVVVPTATAEVVVDIEVPLPEGWMLLDNQQAPHQREFWRYLENRGVYDMTGVGFALTGQYAYRVIFPVMRDGKRAGWIARDITGHGIPKIYHAPGMKASQVLFGLDKVETKEVGIVEGPFDALTIPGRLVATLGAKMSPIQRRLLRGRGITSVTMLWDSDEAGIVGTTKAVPSLLSGGFEVKIAVLPRGVDPNSAGRDMVERAMAGATTVTTSSRRAIRRLIESKLNSIEQVSHNA